MDIMQRYTEMYKAFTEYTMVAKRQNIAGLIPGAQSRTVAEIAEDDDETEAVRF